MRGAACAAPLLLLALGAYMHLVEAGGKSPPHKKVNIPPLKGPSGSEEEFEFECTVIFYTGLQFEGSSFGFTSGPVMWDGIAPLFFTLWDFSKLDVGFPADDQVRSLNFSCEVSNNRTVWTTKELETVIELHLYAWPFRKENGGLMVNYGGIECTNNEVNTVCSMSMGELPGMDRRPSAAAILMNFPDFDPSQGRRPPPPLSTSTPPSPSPPLPPIPPLLLPSSPPATIPPPVTDYTPPSYGDSTQPPPTYGDSTQPSPAYGGSTPPPVGATNDDSSPPTLNLLLPFYPYAPPPTETELLDIPPVETVVLVPDNPLNIPLAETVVLVPDNPPNTPPAETVVLVPDNPPFMPYVPYAPPPDV